MALGRAPWAVAPWCGASWVAVWAVAWVGGFLGELGAVQRPPSMQHRPARVWSHSPPSAAAELCSGEQV